MPELPEVETICRQLSPALLGRELKDIDLLDPKLSISRRAIPRGAKVQSVFRAGKQIVIELQSGARKSYVCVHLRMTGNLIWKRTASSQASRLKKGSSAEPHLRARLHFRGGDLSFFDVRRFGTLNVYQNQKKFRGSAWEPLSPELDEQIFASLLSGRQPLKNWLLRQDKILGVGNIYASEILHRAKLSPLRAANSLSSAEQKELLKCIRYILEKAISLSGTTFSDYRDSEGERGDFQNFLRVYEREGKSCRRCKSTIVRITQAGRSTYYCKVCQG